MTKRILTSRTATASILLLMTLLAVSGVVVLSLRNSPESVAELVLEQIVSERDIPYIDGSEEDYYAHLYAYYTEKYGPYFTEEGLKIALADRRLVYFASAGPEARLSGLDIQVLDQTRDDVTLYAVFHMGPVPEDHALFSPHGWHATIRLVQANGRWKIHVLQLAKNTAPAISASAS